uniref:(northern house mosquito) hypothetical protein n=1 Tax=Culex pipiens TaxID=7175 RepID=A0A8D8G2J0_CULPI
MPPSNGTSRNSGHQIPNRSSNPPGRVHQRRPLADHRNLPRLGNGLRRRVRQFFHHKRTVQPGGTRLQRVWPVHLERSRHRSNPARNDPLGHAVRNIPQH